MEEHKKSLYNSIKNWKEILHILFEEEGNYKNSLIKKYKSELEQSKDEFKEYGTLQNFIMTEGSNFITLKYGGSFVVLRVKFEVPTADRFYSFEFSIKDYNKRLEYFIYILPDDKNIYIPKLSLTTSRPQPNSIEEAKESSKKIADEILFLKQKSEEMNTMKYYYAYHDERNSLSDVNKLKRFDSFYSIIQILMKD